MIKAIVLFTYIDKHTKEQHLEGSVVELEESRAAELKALGAVDFAEVPKPEAKVEKAKEPKEKVEKPKEKKPTTRGKAKK